MSDSTNIIIEKTTNPEEIEEDQKNGGNDEDSILIKNGGKDGNMADVEDLERGEKGRVMRKDREVWGKEWTVLGTSRGRSRAGLESDFSSGRVSDRKRSGFRVTFSSLVWGEYFQNLLIQKNYGREEESRLISYEELKQYRKSPLWRGLR
ncbi:unnamed protein product [Meloidogyne enterolobii]|uniref:Uncharacterized protein n=1 Tax=Meloidogyne enterolobii TaxID=390850 RepID=A0ACB1A1I3_MELEN